MDSPSSPGTAERVWHTIIAPTARELEFFAWRTVFLAFLVKVLFFTGVPNAN